MEGKYRYAYPRPSVTVDLVVFQTGRGGVKVLLVRRKGEPFAGCWALPGGFLEIDEPAEVGARRELAEETGLILNGGVERLGFFDAPGRDPRGRTISLAFVGIWVGDGAGVVGGDDAELAEWRDINGLGILAFDHDAILAEGLAWLSRRGGTG